MRKLGYNSAPGADGTLATQPTAMDEPVAEEVMDEPAGEEIPPEE